MALKKYTGFITEDVDSKEYDKFFEKLPDLNDVRDGILFLRYFKSYISTIKQSGKDVYLLYDLSDI
jgi:hypothetical protein